MLQVPHKSGNVRLLCLDYCTSYTLFRVCVRYVVPRKGFPKPGMFTFDIVVPASLAWARSELCKCVYTLFMHSFGIGFLAE